MGGAHIPTRPPLKCMCLFDLLLSNVHININGLGHHVWTLTQFYYYFFLNSVLRPFQDYFSSYETDQSVGGAKTVEPREKPLDTPASRTWLVSHVARAGLEPTPDTVVR